jgi:hypothetical protein
MEGTVKCCCYHQVSCPLFLQLRTLKRDHVKESLRFSYYIKELSQTKLSETPRMILYYRTCPHFQRLLGLSP